MAFFELNIGMSGLFVAQTGLTVTSNNLTNTLTPGYSRQVLVQKASKPLNGVGVGMKGTGVITDGIIRVRDSYLDTKLWGQQDYLGEYSVKSTQNGMLETVFGEPSDAGFTKSFDDLFSAIDDIAKLPGEEERQIALRQAAISFTKYFNSAATGLEKQQRDLNFEVKATVEEINMLSQRIYSLSKQIQQAEIYGDSANSLRDEREACIDQLSALIDVEAKEVTVVGSDGVARTEFVVKAGGQTLVDGDRIRRLKVEPREIKNNPEDIDNLYDVQWEDGIPFDQQGCSGELRGLLDMRDGRGTLGDVKYNGVPYYMARLNTFVQTFAKEMNKVYGEGEGYFMFTQYDANGNNMATADYLQMTAKNFCISESIFEDASNIRTNYEHKPDVGENPNPGSNNLLLALGAVKNASIFKEGTAEDYMVSIFSELAVNTSEANMYATSQANIIKHINNQRLSVSQVSQDEEFMNLTRYQQAYQSAARIISVMDEIYETTIFKLGNF